MFQVVMKYPDGTKEEQEEVFETREDAHEFGLQCCDNFVAGARNLHEHNRGDYPMDEDEAFDGVDFDVIEVVA